MSTTRAAAFAALLSLAPFACAPAEEPAPDASGPVSSFTVTGSVSAAGEGATATYAADEQVLESFTRRKLTLTFTHPTAGTVTAQLTDSDGAPSSGAYVAYDSQQVITASSWKVGQVEYVNVGVAEEDTSAINLTTLDWTAGGAIAGTLSLTLVDAADATRKVTVAGTFEGTLSTGP